MRKLLYGGLASAILGTCGVYTVAYWATHTPDWEPRAETAARVRVCENQTPTSEGTTGGAQLEVLEPIVVERSTPETDEGDAANGDQAPAVVADAAPWVVTDPGLGVSAPRPDAEIAPRMPFADEEESIQVQRPPCDLVTQLVNLLRDKPLLEELFGDTEEASETPDAEAVPAAPVPGESNEPPMTEPDMPPAAQMPLEVDYHRQHPSCPYHGSCPAPYRYRQVPPIEPPVSATMPMPMK